MVVEINGAAWHSSSEAVAQDPPARHSEVLDPQLAIGHSLPEALGSGPINLFEVAQAA